MYLDIVLFFFLLSSLCTKRSIRLNVVWSPCDHVACVILVNNIYLARVIAVFLASKYYERMIYMGISNESESTDKNVE